MFTEDLDVFVDPSALGDAATLQGGATVNGNYNAEYVDSLGMAGTNPVFECKATDVLETDIGKTLTVRGVTYTIKNRQPRDDGAFVLLQLQG